MATPPKRLGRGLSGLLAGAPQSAPSRPAVDAPAKPQPAVTAAAVPARPLPAGARLAPNGDIELPLTAIEANPHQPRKEFEPERLKELADSIRSEGLIQPVVVRPVGAGRYQLIAGERRWRAFQLLQQKWIPARVLEVPEAGSAASALIENLQRENLNPIEEAQGLASLIKDFSLTQEQVAERVGKGRATIANSLRLLTLSKELQGFVSKGTLSAGHAKVLLGLESEPERAVAARRIVEEGLSVRAAEKLVESMRLARPPAQAAEGRASRTAPELERAAIADIERRLTSHLVARVSLKHGPKKGRLVIEYAGNADLQRILERLGIGS